MGSVFEALSAGIIEPIIAIAIEAKKMYKASEKEISPLTYPCKPELFFIQ
jgi:hypothetical protein